jgi:hypothetical protein
VPPLLYMKTPKFLNATSKYEKFKVYGLVIFGVISMIAGSITSIVDAVSNDTCRYKPLELGSQQGTNAVIYQNCTATK